MSDRFRVIKLGGSLLSWDGFPQALRLWIERYRVKGVQDLIVVGGGKLADEVRSFDKTFQPLGDLVHWAAIGTMDLNAEMVANLCGWETIDIDRLDSSIRQRLHATGIIRTDRSSDFDLTAANDPPHPQVCLTRKWLERRSHLLPISWETTSDSIAALLANRVNASSLVLMKSCDVPSSTDFEDWARAGLVDGYFPQTAPTLSAIAWVNLRGFGSE